MNANAPEWVILGLGNPGEKYSGMRHNIGYEVIHVLARRHAIAVTGRLPNLVYGLGVIAGHPVVLAKPRTFMNLSGIAAQEALQQWRISTSRLLVILDDVALPLGTIRIRKKGSDGGHRGLRSVLTALNTREVPRLRIGVGQPNGGDLADYVLSPFSPKERPVVEAMIECAAEATEVIVAEGIDRAMNQFNVNTRS